MPSAIARVPSRRTNTIAMQAAATASTPRAMLAHNSLGNQETTVR